MSTRRRNMMQSGGGGVFVNYIEQNPNFPQWIDLGFGANNNTRIVIDYMITRERPLYQASFNLFGACLSYSSNGFRAWIRYKDINSEGDQIGYGNYYTYGKMLPNSPINKKLTIDANKQNWKVYDESTIVWEYSFNFANPFTTRNMYILGTNDARYDQRTRIYGNMRVFNAKIYQNDILIHDLKPYKKGKNGLYCVITNKFFENKGDGKFIVG